HTIIGINLCTGINAKLWNRNSKKKNRSGHKNLF
uniref:Uncharacterized protein n=1 Tax=Amphimedon queenslandica TaxID=400682 RepID=A0A1X7UZR3_AMPQE